MDEPTRDWGTALGAAAEGPATPAPVAVLAADPPRRPRTPPPVPLPSGARAAALSIPVEESLGWLAAIGAGLGRDGVGQSVLWLGRVAVTGVRLVAAGSVVPGLRTVKRADARTLDMHVRWAPALVDTIGIDELAAAMPGPITALGGGDARAVTPDVLGAVVDAICVQAGKKLGLPAPPPATPPPSP